MLEIDCQRFFLSEFYKKDPKRLAWIEQVESTIVKKYLWQPVHIHVSGGFLEYGHQQTGGGEVPPYSGILNPLDENGNFILFPWFRMQDKVELMGRALGGASKSEDIDGVLNSWINLLDPANLFAHCDHKLVIPRSELVMIKHNPHDKKKRHNSQRQDEPWSDGSLLMSELTYAVLVGARWKLKTAARCQSSTLLAKLSLENKCLH